MQKTQSVEVDEKPRSSFIVEDDGEPVQVGSSFRPPARSQIRLRKNYKQIRLRHSYEAYIVFLQRCWRAKKNRSFGCHFQSLDYADSPLTKLKSKMTALYIGAKVRRILKGKKMENLKAQAIEIEQFYRD